MWFTNKARVLSEYEDKFVHSPKMKVAIPAVIQYTDDDSKPKFISTVPFNRRNLFIRDHGQCNYCGRKISMNSFTFDHVIPQKFGGTASWTNIVAACQKCNGKKGSKILKSSGMTLRHEPYVPKLTRAAPQSVACDLGLDFEHRIPHPSWNDYIYWSVVKVN